MLNPGGERGQGDSLGRGTGPRGHAHMCALRTWTFYLRAEVREASVTQEREEGLQSCEMRKREPGHAA